MAGRNSARTRIPTCASSGASFGTLTVADVIINSNGRALNLINGTVAATFGSITSTGGVNNVNLNKLLGSLTISAGAMSGATGNAFDVNTSGGTADISYAGTIASGSAHSVNVSGKTGGTVRAAALVATGAADAT